MPTCLSRTVYLTMVVGTGWLPHLSSIILSHHCHDSNDDDDDDDDDCSGYLGVIPLENEMDVDL